MTIYAKLPVNHPGENLRGSFLPEACLDDGCEESPGSQCRYPEPETEPSPPHVEPAPPCWSRTAADAPGQFQRQYLTMYVFKHNTSTRDSIRKTITQVLRLFHSSSALFHRPVAISNK